MSIIIPTGTDNSNNNVENFLKHLEELNLEYEVILCTNVEADNFDKLNLIVSKYSNTSAYEIISKDLDNVVTYALEIALGDWVFILEDENKLSEHFLTILEVVTSKENLDCSVVVLKSKKRNLRDVILTRLSRYLMEVKVSTFQRASRGASRSSLVKWNQRAFKNKVLRVASNVEPNTRRNKQVDVETTADYNSHKLFRIGIRTMIYSSVAPLRLVSGISIASAGLAAGYSAYVVFIKYNQVPTPGWASTNLLLSISSLLLLVILSAICEYMYQLIGTVVQSQSIRIANESLNSQYSFIEKKDVHEK